MILIKNVIISFPALFQPKAAIQGQDPKFSVTMLIPPTDAENLQTIQAAVQQAIADGYPSGMPANAKCCFMAYDAKYQGKEYYDPRFTGYHVLTATADPKDGKPSVVDSNGVDIIDPGRVYSGCLAHVSVNISKYTPGTGGIGCWINGVMTDGQEGPMGRLDNKPTVDQMFKQVTGNPVGGVPAVGPGPAPVAPIAPAVAPAVPAPMAPAAPAPVRQMTPAAQGTYEQYIAAGWDDQKLIAAGLMLPPGNVPVAF